MTSKLMHNHLRRNLGILLLLLVLPLFSLGNDQADVLFAKGNQQYAKGQYKGAIQTYQQVLDKGYESAAIYFNLGNANYKMDNIAAAILNYEKANKLNPGDDDIKVNLQLANLKITDKIEMVPEFFLAKWWNAFILFFSAQTLTAASIVFCLPGFVFLIIYLFANAITIKKPAFYAGIVIVLLSVVTFLTLKIQVHYFNARQQAIVFAGTVNVKSSPNATSRNLFVIHEGTKVTISQNEHDWIKVELPNGNVGWMELSGVRSF